MNIAADNTSMNIESENLMETIYPTTEIRKQLESYETLLFNEKAKQLLNWQPNHSFERLCESGEVSFMDQAG